MTDEQIRNMLSAAIAGKASAEHRVAVVCKERDQLRAALKAENAGLRAALEWYASPKTWNQWCPESFADRARKALEGGNAE